MEPEQKIPTYTNDPCNPYQPDDINGEFISIQECKKYLEEYNLSDKRIIEIKDNLIGIINCAINSYLEEFK